MSEVDEVRALDFTRQYVAYRPPQAYDTQAYNLFTIVGGPVIITALFFHAEQVLGTGSTGQMVVCGVDIDPAGASNMDTAVGGTGIWSLETTAGWTAPVFAISNPCPTLAGATAGAVALLVSPGGAGGNNIVLTVTTANLTALIPWYCVFRKMNEWSNIIPG